MQGDGSKESAYAFLWTKACTTSLLLRNAQTERQLYLR